MWPQLCAYAGLRPAPAHADPLYRQPPPGVYGGRGELCPHGGTADDRRSSAHARGHPCYAAEIRAPARSPALTLTPRLPMAICAPWAPVPVQSLQPAPEGRTGASQRPQRGAHAPRVTARHMDITAGGRPFARGVTGSRPCVSSRSRHRCGSRPRDQRSFQSEAMRESSTNEGNPHLRRSGHRFKRILKNFPRPPCQAPLARRIVATSPRGNRKREELGRYAGQERASFTSSSRPLTTGEVTHSAKRTRKGGSPGQNWAGSGL